MNPAKPKSPTRGRPTRDRILDSALAVFGERGYSAATTKEIAGKAEVNEVTLFRHFKSKEALFAATISERSPVVEIGRAVSFDVEGRIEETIARNVKMVLTILRSNKHMFMVVMGDAWRQPKLRAMIGTLTVKRGLNHLIGFMKAQMDAGRLRRMDPEVPARALMGMVQAYFLMNDLLEGRRANTEREDKIIRGFVSIFLDGMRHEQGGRTR